MSHPQALIVGGGFYGCAIALHLAHHGVAPVHLVECADDLLTRASQANQARVHNGYHYPRSFITAYRSRVNMPQFNRDYGFAVSHDCRSLYAIARQSSKVTPAQFEHFMADIGASFSEADNAEAKLFDAHRIAAVYQVEEPMFNVARLREHFHRALMLAGVHVHLHTRATLLRDNHRVAVHLRGPEGERTVHCPRVFNCTYAGFNHLLAPVHSGPLTPLKHEVAELALIDAPEAVAPFNITVMDGPFFSLTQFPSQSCHCLTHVRYTPHEAFFDNEGALDPSQSLCQQPPQTRVHFMIADSARYLPALRHVRYRGSYFEIKTLLTRREVDDGRPILLRRETGYPNLYSVLGGKIDNIYDILARLDALLVA